MRPLPLTVAALTAALLSALAGCASSGGSPAADGPLSSSASMHGPVPRGSVCTPGGHPVAFANELFTNYGDTTVVLDRVVLLHPHNERLVGSYALPGDLVIGTVYWPLRNPGLPPTWVHRQSVHSFRLGPGKSFNMVLGVAASRRAVSQGMLVYYHDSSGTYVTKNYFANIISANTHSC